MFHPLNSSTRLHGAQSRQLLLRCLLPWWDEGYAQAVDASTMNIKGAGNQQIVCLNFRPISALPEASCFW